MTLAIMHCVLNIKGSQVIFFVLCVSHKQHLKQPENPKVIISQFYIRDVMSRV